MENIKIKMTQQVCNVNHVAKVSIHHGEQMHADYAMLVSINRWLRIINTDALLALLDMQFLPKVNLIVFNVSMVQPHTIPGLQNVNLVAKTLKLHHILNNVSHVLGRESTAA